MPILLKYSSMAICSLMRELSSTSFLIYTVGNQSSNATILYDVENQMSAIENQLQNSDSITNGQFERSLSVLKSSIKCLSFTFLSNCNSKTELANLLFLRNLWIISQSSCTISMDSKVDRNWYLGPF